MSKSATSVGVIAILSATALWGHVEPQQSASAEYQKAYDEAFEVSFRTAYRSKFIDSCSSSAPQAKAAGYDITPTCACAADTLLAANTVAQLQAISKDASSQEPKIVMAKCLKSNPPTLAPKP